MSDEDDNDSQNMGSSRKRRGGLDRTDTEELSEFGTKGKETDAGVKEVTRGVKEVELDDKAEVGHVDRDADEKLGTGEAKAEERQESVDEEGQGKDDVASAKPKAEESAKGSVVKGDEGQIQAGKKLSSGEQDESLSPKENSTTAETSQPGLEAKGSDEEIPSSPVAAPEELVVETKRKSDLEEAAEETEHSQKDRAATKGQ